MLAAVLHGAEDLKLEPVEDRPLAADEVRLAFRAGGICGSDLSYYFKGRVGDFALQEPLVLGHEVAGEIVETGAAVMGLKPGDRVAIDPSRPCLTCDYCRCGRSNLCRHMRFFGSAAIFPHVQGAFSEHVVARADQCHVIPDTMPWRVAACAEPLAVCLHAIERAGEILGRSVVIAGAGPIGCLMALAARAKGAGHVTVTDLVDAPLEVAKACGADEVVNVRDAPDRLERLQGRQGAFRRRHRGHRRRAGARHAVRRGQGRRCHRPGRHAATGRGARAGQQADGARDRLCRCVPVPRRIRPGGAAARAPGASTSPRS